MNLFQVFRPRPDQLGHLHWTPYSMWVYDGLCSCWVDIMFIHFPDFLPQGTPTPRTCTRVFYGTQPEKLGMMVTSCSVDVCFLLLATWVRSLEISVFPTKRSNCVFVLISSQLVSISTDNCSLAAPSSASRRPQASQVPKNILKHLETTQLYM